MTLKLQSTDAAMPCIFTHRYPRLLTYEHEVVKIQVFIASQCLRRILNCQNLELAPRRLVRTNKLILLLLWHNYILFSPFIRRIRKVDSQKGAE